MSEIKELEQRLDFYLRNKYSPKDRLRCSEAIKFCYLAHEGQFRRSGEVFAVHPLAGAVLLAELNLDADTIIACLLHDLPEDTDFDLNQIQKKFGKTVARLVDGVTKLSKVNFKKAWIWFGPVRVKKIAEHERQAETYRKMFMAMSKDVRVVFIKLADRLHNMRTLSAIAKDKQLRIANETLEIYAPIADRLGIGHWKGELEDLAFPYIYPQESALVESLARKELKRRQYDIEKTKKQLLKFLSKENIRILDIHGRIKHRYSLWKKLLRYDNDISKIYDLGALRIIVDNEKDCYAVLGLIHDHWKPLAGRIKDYIAQPKPNGYQSIHTTVYGPSRRIVEIQIRTRQMHLQAEMGLALHWHYTDQKNNNVSKQSKQFWHISKDRLAWIHELANWQKSATNPASFQEEVSYRFFKNRIFVFTPQGDAKELPESSVPIDFAYAIHTEVGHHCIGAKVNGKMTTLTSILKSGDVVEILINKKSSGPKSDWLRSVKSSLARNRIRHALKLSNRS